MTTTLADTFNSQPDWWITIGREPFPAVPNYHGAKDCTLDADIEAVGTYHLVLGSGGCDSGHREFRIATTSAAPASVAVFDVDNTHKTLRFQNSAGAGVAPDQISVSVRRVATP